MTISEINYWDQVNSQKNLWKFWNGPLCRNKSGPFPLLNVAAYWKSSNTETCAKNLSQILANNIDNGGREIGLRIYMTYCRWLLWNFFKLFSFLCSVFLTWIRSQETFAHMRQSKIFPLFKMKWNNKVARESSEDHLIKLFKPIHNPCLSTTKNWRHVNLNLGRLFWSFFYGEGVWRVKLTPAPCI